MSPVPGGWEASWGDAPLFEDEFPKTHVKSLDYYKIEWVETDRYTAERRFGPFRWRGHLNMKDIVERIISGSIAGMTAAATFWLLTRLVG